MACAETTRQGMAHITQRKLKAGGSLLISYQFKEGETLFTDSMEIPNRIIPHDSVQVVYAAGNPSKSHLILPWKVILAE